MDKFKQDKKKILNDIYTKSLLLGFFGDIQKININYDVILRDLYFINKFFSYLYGILNSKMTEDQMAKQISKIKDPYNKKIFTLKDAKSLIKKHKTLFLKFYKGLLRNKITQISTYQRGGATFTERVNQTGETIDSIVHPIYHYRVSGNTDLEQFLRGIPVDVIGIFITNLDFIWDLASPLIHAILTTVGSVLTTGATTGAATGIGTLIAGVGEVVTGPVGNILGPSAWTLLGDPLLNLLTEKITDIARFFFDVANKNMGSAINRLITIIPYLDDIQQTVLRVIFTIKTPVEEANRIIQNITSSIHSGVSATSNILENPELLVNRESIYTTIIRRGIEKTPYYKHLDETKKSDFKLALDKVWNTTNLSVDCVIGNKAAIIKELGTDTKQNLSSLLAPCVDPLLQMSFQK